MFILHSLLEREFFDSAEKRIKWHRENIKDGYLDETIKSYELLSLHKRGLIHELLPVDKNKVHYQTALFLTELINTELKYNQNDYIGSYFNILENLILFLEIILYFLGKKSEKILNMISIDFPM